MRNPFRRRKARAPSRPVLRSIDMGGIDRLNSDWLGTDLTLNQMLYSKAETIRKRARDLSLNSPWARRFLAMARTNVVGPAGFSFSAKGMLTRTKLDDEGNKEIERLWAEWRRPENCSMSGQQSLTDLCSQGVTNLLQDGEVVLRMVPGAPNKFGFALAPLPIDLLDHTLNRDLIVDASGNLVQTAIKLGVEVDQWDRPVAYHFKDAQDSAAGGGLGYSYKKHIVYPAHEIIHLFPHERPGQTRGFSFMAPAGTRTKMLNAYEEAAVIHKRIAASKMGFLESDPENPPSGDYSGDGENSDGSTATAIEPGIIEKLPLGYKFSSFDVDDVSDGFSDFCKVILRSVASAWNVNYMTLANDPGDANYSSLRHFTLEDRDAWMCIQNMIIEHVLNRVYAEWLRMTLSMGITFINAGNYDRFMRFAFQGRRWSWIDPAKEEAANKMALENGTTSRHQICRAQGVDFDQIVDERKKEEEMLGISTATGGQVED
jgi:lambda family phage portal protein